MSFKSRGHLLWTPNSIKSVNATHLEVQFGTDHLYFVKYDDSVVFEFSPWCFTTKLAVNKATAYIVPPRRQSVSVEVVQSAEAVVTSGAAVGGAASMSGASAAQAARSMSILAIDACEFDVTEQPPRTSYPAGVPITSDDLRYVYGMMLLNPAVLICAAGFHFMISGWAARMCHWTLRRALAKMWFPNLSLVVVMFLMQDSVGSIFTVFLHSDITSTTNGQMWWAVVAMALLLLWVGFCTFFTWFVTKNVGAFVENDDVKPHALKRFFFGTGDWEDDAFFQQSNEGYVNMFGSFFDAYRFERRWFIAIEFGMVFLTGFITAIQPDNGDCSQLSLWMTVAFFAYMVLMNSLRPYFVPANMLFFSMLSIVQFFASFFLTLPAWNRRKFGELREIGAIMTVASMYALGAKTALDLILVLLDICFSVRHRNRKVREQAKAERAKHRQGQLKFSSNSKKPSGTPASYATLSDATKERKPQRHSSPLSSASSNSYSRRSSLLSSSAVVLGADDARSGLHDNEVLERPLLQIPSHHYGQQRSSRHPSRHHYQGYGRKTSDHESVTPPHQAPTNPVAHEDSRRLRELPARLSKLRSTRDYDPFAEEDYDSYDDDCRMEMDVDPIGYDEESCSSVSSWDEFVHEADAPTSYAACRRQEQLQRRAEARRASEQSSSGRWNRRSVRKKY